MTPTIDATSYRSPNYSDRGGATIDMLVLHTGEGTKKSDLDTLCSTRPPPNKRVSSHYYVDRAGNIYELVSPIHAAWHAGISFWEGRGSPGIRDSSIGIETEHKQGQDWPSVQKEALRQLCLHLIAQYSIPQAMVVAHRWIAPNRKFDPTDWPNEQLRPWIAALYSKPRPLTARYRLKAGSVVFTDRRPDAPLAKIGGEIVFFEEGREITVGDITAGWAWDASQIGFLPMAVMEGPLP